MTSKTNRSSEEIIKFIKNHSRHLKPEIKNMVKKIVEDETITSRNLCTDRIISKCQEKNISHQMTETAKKLGGWMFKLKKNYLEEYNKLII